MYIQKFGNLELGFQMVAVAVLPNNRPRFIGVGSFFDPNLEVNPTTQILNEILIAGDDSTIRIKLEKQVGENRVEMEPYYHNNGLKKFSAPCRIVATVEEPDRRTIFYMSWERDKVGKFRLTVREEFEIISRPLTQHIDIRDIGGFQPQLIRKNNGKKQKHPDGKRPHSEERIKHPKKTLETYLN